MGAEWRHDALARDLAAHLWAGGQRLTWVDFAPMGAGTARPDVFAIRRHAYTAPEILSYEVKISAADLRSDLTSGKWQKYLDFSSGVTFAVPQGLAGRRDIPEQCGLIVRSARGWRHARKPALRAVDLPAAAALRLICTPAEYARRSTPLSELSEHAVDRIALRRAMGAVGRRLGKQVAAAVAAEATGENRQQKALAAHEAGQAELRRMLRDLASVVGLPAAASAWDVRDEIARLRARLTRDGEIAALRRFARSARQALEYIDLATDKSAGGGE